MNKIRSRFNVYLMLTFAALAVLAIPLLTVTGCKNGPNLESGGAYNQFSTNADGTVTAKKDTPLYVADQSFEVAYNTLNAAFTIEQNNADFFWKISPQIKKSLDKVRPGAWEAVKSYVAARDAYIKNPVPANLDGLNAVIARMQQFVYVANAALGQVTAAPVTNIAQITASASLVLTNK